jgi:hypothetical protein
MMWDFRSITRTIHHLLSQTALKDLEIVLVTTPANVHQVDTEILARAGAYQVVTIPRFDTAAQGWAEGVRKARSPIAVLCEDHSFPDPDWAQALIEEHSREWAAVAPVVHNGNPATAVSWANFLLCFLDWHRPRRSGAVESGPGHNTCYHRDTLAPYSKSLDRWFNPERVLHLDFQAKGLKVLQSQRAATRHVNISKPLSYLAHSFCGGRLFGGSRAERWSKVKALAYACAFPLVPAVRLRRILAHLDTPERRKEAQFSRALPWIVAGLFCHALGEATGYLAGTGNAMEKYMSFETRRRDHLVPEEQSLLEAPAHALTASAAAK